MILNNGFSQLRNCIANGPSFDSSELTLRAGPTNLLSFILKVETAHDFDEILNTCSHLRRIHVTCLSRQQMTFPFSKTSQTTIKNLELTCYHASMLKILPLRLINIVKLKLILHAWPTHTLFENLAMTLNSLSLRAFTCRVGAYQISDYPMELEILNEGHIKNLHALFKYVTIQQENNEYCVDGEDSEWNKYSFKMQYSVRESVNISSFS